MDNYLYKKAKPAVWGGLECTINRVGDRYFDQFEWSGQYEGLSGLQAACDLGISKLRFPILWERHFDNAGAWDYTRKQLDLLAKNNVEPIAGLLHHGSGPSFTQLDDPEFPGKFAAYATEVASAFPSIKYYTPINEPLTTARFSGLYGFWYPHQKDELVFATIFLNQLKGIVLAMKAIRAINPGAELIQTEDLCKIHSTPELSYQADFENERRWWTYDFLTGIVSPKHAAWEFFTAVGIDESFLRFFMDNPCPPSVAGFNYYVTSERYLDHNISNYPPGLWGTNGRDTYIDTEAARSGHRAGLKILMTEAWDRYHLPLALTECHLSCTREQQVRWFQQQWSILQELCVSGIPVVSITAWSLVGAYDWDSLVTRPNGHYESGAFDDVEGFLRPTLLASMIKEISNGYEFHHPVLEGHGWWDDQRSDLEHSQPIIIYCDEKKSSEIIRSVCGERSLYALVIDPSTNSPIALEDNDQLFKRYQAWASITILIESEHVIIRMRYLKPVGVIAGIYHYKTLEVESPYNNAKVIHLALDLLIDGAEGKWQLNASTGYDSSDKYLLTNVLVNTLHEIEQ